MKQLWTRRTVSRPLIFCALTVLGLVGAAACGDDDDVSDIQETATAAARAATATAQVITPAPTDDPATVYREEVRTLGEALAKAAGTLQADMIAAGESQADPKWPQVLGADVAAVLSAAQELTDLDPPAGQETLDGQVEAAAQKFFDGANLMRTAVERQDPQAGAQAAAALGEGQAMLEAVLSGLD